MKTWRDILHKTADYIQAHGWTFGRMRTATGEVCAMGGLIMANSDRTTEGDPLFVAAPQLWHDPIVSQAMHIFEDFVGTDIIMWNDRFGLLSSPTRFRDPQDAKREVVETLRACADQELPICFEPTEV